MAGNQRLQTFAALCAGQSDAPTDETREASSGGAQSGIESQNSVASALSSSSSSTTQQPQLAQDAVRQQGIANVQTQQQSPLQNLNSQQLQQAIARAALGGGNPSLAAGLFMQGGLPTQQFNDAAMTQIALQQYIQQAQQAYSTQQASQSLSAAAAAASGSGGLRESQALVMAALAGGQANPFGHVAGKNLLLLLYLVRINQ